MFRRLHIGLCVVHPSIFASEHKVHAICGILHVQSWKMLCLFGNPVWEQDQS